MSINEGKYNIKAASNMLGIQPGTLRAWERRYQMIAPVRKESGHRLYTEEHIKILRWLIQKVDKGFTISQAVSLLEKGGHSLLDASRSEIYQDQDLSKEIVEHLLQALLTFDEGKAHEMLDKMLSKYSVEKVLIDISGILLVKLIDLLEREEISITQEHYTSAFLRSRLGILLHGHLGKGFLPKTVSVCGPGEGHELSLLVYTLFVRRKGFETIYLGTSITDYEIHLMLKEIKPKFLFLSCTFSMNLPNTLDLVVELHKQYPDLMIGLTGVAVDKMSNQQKHAFQAFLTGNTLTEWESWLHVNMNSTS
ncbi:MerR family transcriptional regulator [Sutcliffiella halmapala]|uniref:MerR family transcriptional regulator n=1 Tax=Sutcliffiella halmapala TaxID=79882 RepID=UPI00099542CB|nr:MerR family transcriptional regulator [Sutcliffiella halmapala]